jgi:hypothetical protein
MDFLDSIGYDQINVNPVQFMNYDDSEYKIRQMDKRTPASKKIHEKAREKQQYSDYLKTPPPYSSLGMQRHKEKRNFKNDLEDIMRPYSRQLRSVNKLDSMTGTRDSEFTKKCQKCEEDAPEKNMFLIILIMVLMAFCVMQYVDAQNVNSVLLNIIKQQRGENVVI